MADEKIYTVNLSGAWNAAYKKRAKKSIFIIKEYVMRHAGAKTAKVALHLNEQIWARGAKNPPRSVKIQIVKEKDDIFWAESAGVKFELPKKPEAKKEEKPKEEPAKEEEAKPAKEKKEGALAPAEKAEGKTEAAPAKEEKPVKEEGKAPEKAKKPEKEKTAPAAQKAKPKKKDAKPPAKKAEVAEKPKEEKPAAKKE